MKVNNMLKFGNIALNKSKLEQHLFIIVKDHKGKSLNCFSKHKTTQPLVKIILNYANEGIIPCEDEIKKLDNKDQILWDRLVMLGHLRQVLPHTIELSIKRLKDKSLTEMNEREYKDNLHGLYNIGVITRQEMDSNKKNV